MILQELAANKEITTAGGHGCCIPTSQVRREVIKGQPCHTATSAAAVRQTHAIYEPRPSTLYRAAILFSRETKLLEAAVNGEKSNGGERVALLTSGRVLMEGGVPIIDPAHGKIIGACGVSGVKPQEDAEVAKAAVNSLFPQAKL